MGGVSSISGKDLSNSKRRQSIDSAEIDCRFDFGRPTPSEGSPALMGVTVNVVLYPMKLILEDSDEMKTRVN